MLTADPPSRQVDLLSDGLGLGPNWEIEHSADGRFEIRHRDRGTPYRPTTRPLPWAGLLQRLESDFRAAGVSRARPLPMRWGRDTELTISAVQALDPLLKDGEPYVLRRGYLPQPVVRLTGERDGTGALRDGFLTSFVNISRIEPVTRKAEFTGILDHWLTLLSRIGLHARHITIHGRNAVWQRREVCGLTVHFRHLDLPIGDIVLLWNAADPSCMAVDLGSGLERLAWARTRRPWWELVFDSFATVDVAPDVLDAVRTATILVGNGIAPAARGAGGVVRRILAAVPAGAAPLGVGALVRASHGFWSLTSPMAVPWPEVASVIEREICRRVAAPAASLPTPRSSWSDRT
ncbi:hypothetical protein P3T27_000235 [Kitasatospora sp. MAA19]|uniref:hypothetical protein n=1 Tax=Kitasatospora sp. MAA19 TaxID=3035090 RepID=UPI002474DBB0|nr:hypothetical protein [Kitasatospora sp. MAA19]MDH6703554.1 hypothetical protein [Kitasatospora sp. MAA19]